MTSASRPRSPSPPILMVFAKAPEPGRVKTRLARQLGDVEAARIYRHLGRSLIDRVRGGPYRTVVYFDPSNAERAMIEWLGREGLEFEPQPPGDLGQRLVSAFDWGFARSDLVAAVGTDIPGVDGSTIETTFARLSGTDATDVVFGPALDGGYYLVGLRRPAPSLFHDIPWSTDVVLERSLSRAEAAGLRVERLGPLADVDHARDVPEELLQDALSGADIACRGRFRGPSS